MHIRKHALSAAFILLLAAALSPVFALNTARYTYAGIPDNDVALLKRAMNLAVIRMQDRNVWLNTYGTAKYALVTSYAYRDSHLLRSNENSWNLLWRQLYYLSLPNDPDDTSPAFPNIKVTGVYAPPAIGGRGWLGRASYNTVGIEMVNGVVRQKGEFQIQLNTYYMGRSAYYSDANEWAATIAHEMLHNLGHRHDDKNVDYESLQIITFDHAVKFNGKYVRSTSNTKMAMRLADEPDECGN